MANVVEKFGLRPYKNLNGGIVAIHSAWKE